MARQVVTAILRLLARLFFRAIEIVGPVPEREPVVFAVNHPNALIDPLFLLCFAPRRVSFLAKAPLFTMPVIGALVRALDCIPVYRRQDNAATASTRETFARARAVLADGGAIAIFPEGTTHSDPKLRELKTGVSRIALGASLRVLVIPTGLYYTAKHAFRSSALVYFGEPIVVEPQQLDDRGEPDTNAVDALTARIEEALATVTLEADSHEALDLIDRAERLFSSRDPGNLADEFELRKRFLAGYRYLCERDPGRLARLQSAIAQVEAPQRRGDRHVAHLLLLPLGFAGAVIHWPAYRLIDAIATRTDREMAATVKVLTGAVLYPLMWLSLAVFAGSKWGLAYALATVVALPLLAYCALVSAEAIEQFAARSTDASAIRDEIMSVAAEMDRRAVTAESDRGAGSAAVETQPERVNGARRH